MQPFALMHDSSLFSFSYSKKCFLICVSDDPTADSSHWISFPTSNFVKSSVILLSIYTPTERVKRADGHDSVMSSAFDLLRNAAEKLDEEQCNEIDAFVT